MSKVVVGGELHHPLDNCIQLLQDLIFEIQQRQEVTYVVPYEELDNIQFSLSPTPDDNISEFNEKYAFVQSHCNRVGHILIQVKKEIKIWNSFRNRAKSLYRKAKNNLLTTVTDIKNLRNKELQEAAIQERVPEVVDLLEGLDILIEELEYDIDIIKIKKELLDSANLNLSRQQRVVEDLIALNTPVGGSIRFYSSGKKNDG